MKIETDRLIIRSIQQGDEVVFSDMAQDGSLGQVGFCNVEEMALQIISL